MASCYGNAAKREQIVTEFFAKSLHIILEARSPFVSSRSFSGETMSSPASSSSSSSSHRPRDKWFNLALPECPAAWENIDFWQHCNLKPMVVDVVLVRGSLDHEPGKFCPSWKDQEEKRHEKVTESVIERWVVLYENQKGKDSASSSKRSGTRLTVFYKKLLVLLRSLYSTARLLPAYKLFRGIISSGRLHAVTLKHRLRSFIDPCIGGEEAGIQRFKFTPVDSCSCRLSVSVSYKSSLPELTLEPSSSPMSSQIIRDYIGSPLADPFKRFPSFPTCHSSPSYSPITRNNSWNTDIFHGSPAPLTHVTRTHTTPMSLPSRLPDTKYRTTGDVKFSPIQLPCAKSSMEPLHFDYAPVRVHSTQHPSTGLPPPPSPSSPGNVPSDRSSGTSGIVAEKCSVDKGERGRVSRTKLLFDISPRVPFSRRSSWLDYNDSEFDCPFVLDGDDMIIPVGSEKGGEPFEADGGSAVVRRSQDAAVGALLSMLRKAPPLCQDFNSIPTSSSPASISKESPGHSAGTTTSNIGQVMPKTAAHALKEIRGFRDMKGSLLKNLGRPRDVLDKG